MGRVMVNVVPSCSVDVMMPEMDGIAMLKEIEKTPRYAEIPVIVLTNVDDMNTIANIIAHGGHDYFIKAETPVAKIAEHAIEKIGV